MQAVIERERARDELESLQQRFDASVAEMQQRTSRECDVVRRETETARQQLQLTVRHLAVCLSVCLSVCCASSCQPATAQSHLHCYSRFLPADMLSYLVTSCRARQATWSTPGPSLKILGLVL